MTPDGSVGGRRAPGRMQWPGPASAVDGCAVLPALAHSEANLEGAPTKARFRSLGWGLWLAIAGAVLGCGAGEQGGAARAGMDAGPPLSWDAAVGDGAVGPAPWAPDSAVPPPAAADSGLGVRPDAGLDRAQLATALRSIASAYPPVRAPVENALTAEKALLGKALFWDVQLSTDDSVACGTCHTPRAGGADGRPALPDAVGHPGADDVLGTADDPRGSPGMMACDLLPDGGIVYRDDPVFGRRPQVTRRRSMSFLDVMFPFELFWDGRARDAFVDPLADGGVAIPDGAALESQALMPILNEVEMSCRGASWETVMAKLARARPLAYAQDLGPDLVAYLSDIDDYTTLFEQAFGTADISPTRIAMAIASYERTLTSNQAPWDRFQAGDDDALSDQQLRGLHLFTGLGGCNACHQLPLFRANFYVNDGFNANLWDEGRAEVTMGASHRGAFRIVSLRNVGLREAGGLLHDGLFPGTSLLTLVQAYNQPPYYGSGPFRRALHLTDDDIDALVVFLREALTDPRVASGLPPFDHPTPGGG